MIDKLSGDGLNAATLYHLGADMEGAGIADFKGYIAGYIGLIVVSLLPLFATRVKRWRRPGHGGAWFAGFAVVWIATIMVSPLARDGQHLYQQLRPVDQQLLRRHVESHLQIVAETVGARLQNLEAVHVGLVLAGVGAARRERDLDRMARRLGRLFDADRTAQHDQVGDGHVQA